MATKKATKKTSKSLGGIKAAAKSAVGALTGKKSSGGTGRKHKNRGPAYWANKVLVQKLKRKYNRLKYAGV